MLTIPWLHCINGAKVYGPIIPGENHCPGQPTISEKLRVPLYAGRSRIILSAEKRFFPMETSNFFPDGLKDDASKDKYSDLFCIPSSTCMNAWRSPASFMAMPGINAKALVPEAFTIL